MQKMKMMLSMNSWKFWAKEATTITRKRRMERVCAGLVIFFVALGKYRAKSIPRTMGMPRSRSICQSIGRKGMTSRGMSPEALIAL